VRLTHASFCMTHLLCPLCAIRRGAKQVRAYLQRLEVILKDNPHLVPYLVTLTVSNGPNLRERFNHLHGSMARYTSRMRDADKKGRGYCELNKIRGAVWSYEVTNKGNGWHPHVHELVFLSAPVALDDLEEDLSRIWQGAALRAGLDLPSRVHGLTVQDGSKAAKYASKWGLESELTQWHRKHGKIESRTPFDLLRDVAENLEDKQSGRLFRQYAEAFHGRHQLQFSRGLKQLYSIAEISDEELVQAHDEDAFLLGSLDLDQWRVICTTETRGLFLEVAANGGWDAVGRLLVHLRRLRDDRPDYGAPGSHDTDRTPADRPARNLRHPSDRRQ